jgi:hypothetical protein
MQRMLLLFCFLSSAFIVHGQTVVQQTPQNVQQRIFNGVNTAQTGNITRNIGQNVHLVTYITAGTDATTRLRVRLEASNDGTNFFAISSDATDITSGAVISFGFFPVLRVNLVTYSGAGTLTLHYAGTNSVSDPPPGGIFNPAQVVRRVVTYQQTGAVNQTIGTPFGNAAGSLVLSCGAPAQAGTTIAINGVSEGGLGTVNLMTGVSFEAAFKALPVPPIPSKQINVVVTDPAQTCSITYFFTPPVMLSMPGNDTLAGAGIQPWDSPIVCKGRANITLSGAGNTQILAVPSGPAAARRHHICHISFALDTVVDVKLTEGTGVNCATGTADITGLYQNVSALGLDFGGYSPLMASRSTAICINLSGAAVGGGVVIFATFPY